MIEAFVSLSVCILGSAVSTAHAQQAGHSPSAAPAAAHATTPQPEDESVDRFASDKAAVLGFTMTDITGEAVDLGEYAGKVVVFVNVASKCGLTPQYEGLQALFEKYEEQGLVVLGFPANNFRGQEPGTDEEILEFCTGTYDVTFPMFSKISVVGEDQHPLYTKMTAAMEEQGGEPSWNFTKYAVDRSGRVVRRFDPQTAPNDAKFIDEIERLLAEPAPERAEPAEDADG